MAVSFIGGGNPSARTNVTDKLYPIMLYMVYLASTWYELTASVMIGTDCIGSCKSNYHMITTATTPKLLVGTSNKLHSLKVHEVQL